jgi:hypothetical protein
MVLSSAGAAPENLGLGRVQLKSVGLRPGSDVVGTLGKADSKSRNIRNFAEAINLSVTSTSMRKNTRRLTRENKSAT